MVTALDDLGWTVPCCPEPPEWRIDWPAILAAYPLLATLAGVPQEPAYHAEGDVLIHTRSVAEALAAMPAWRALPSPVRPALFASALLHDIGKPRCTQVQPDGRISSPGHARAGATIARQLLWRQDEWGSAVPFTARESVTALVRLHGLPIWFLDKEDPDRALFTASYRAPLDQVSLLAEADARGRICADQDELLARIDLFRETCRSLGCLDRPRAFPSDHGRVRYFRGLQQEPGYEPWDDTWGEVVLLAGLPGAGKDHWLRESLPDLPVISLDAIRRERGIGPDKPQGPVVRAAKDQAREWLRRRQPFAWNATNLTRHLRDPLIDLFLGYGARVRVVYVDAPLGVVLQRNRARPSPVPEGVILRLAAKLELPDLTEAHHVEYFAPDLAPGPAAPL
ncbi:MAG TPA: AAA family ATPase [Thermoanaerobaculia bacterium]|nr:AAA family ATPase [Thermoanaerobaculia bacterium]